MPQLKRVQINGFKSIKELDLELRNLNVLIGPNGAGKSNFIQSFDFLRNIVNRNLQRHVTNIGGANNLLFKGVKNTKKLFMYYDFNPNYYEITLEPNAVGGLSFYTEFVGYRSPDYDNPYWTGLTGEELGESSLYSSNERIARYVRANLEAWKIYHFHDTSPESPVKQTQPTTNFAELDQRAGNIAAFLYHLQQVNSGSYLRIVENIRIALPFFLDFYLQPSDSKGLHIRLQWRQVGTGDIYDVSVLSDGSIRYICLTTLLLQPNLPSLILIDEAELGLHPAAIIYLAAMLRKAATKTQIIVSTQSPSLVSEFEPEDVIVVDSSNEGTEFSRLDSGELKNWLENYTLGEIWNKNLIGGNP